MEKAREIQLNALDNLGRDVARLDEILNDLQRQKNTFDAEAKIYRFMQIAEKAASRAKNLHWQIHTENSMLLYGNAEVRS